MGRPGNSEYGADAESWASATPIVEACIASNVSAASTRGEQGVHHHHRAFNLKRYQQRRITNISDGKTNSILKNEATVGAFRASLGSGMAGTELWAKRAAQFKG